MTKQQLLLLSDYLKDKSKERLGILANAINPSFKLNAGSKAKLELLIRDYEGDASNKQRLKIIESFLGSSASSPATKSNKSTKPISKLLPISQESFSLIDRAIDYPLTQEEEEDYIALSVRIKAKVKLSEEDQEKYQLLAARLENYAPSYTPDQVKAMEARMVKQYLGDKENPASMAARLLNGEVTRGQITSIYDPVILIKKLFLSAGKDLPFDFESKILSQTSYKTKYGSISMPRFAFGPIGSLPTMRIFNQSTGQELTGEIVQGISNA